MTNIFSGNHCSGGEKGRDPGNGRLVIAKYYEHKRQNGGGDKGHTFMRKSNRHDKYDCGWEVTKVVHIPSSAYFGDYSDLSFRGNKVGH